jgi:hypothetical protein
MRRAVLAIPDPSMPLSILTMLITNAHTGNSSGWLVTNARFSSPTRLC